MLERIYDILYTFRAYVLLAFLIIISLILISLNDNSQIKHIRSIAAAAFGLIQEPLSFIPKYFRLKSENDLLRQVNIELAHETQQLREAKLENIRLRQLLGLKEQISYKLVTARVIGKNFDKLRNTFTLNVGSTDNIKPQMPVVSQGGLVGVVVCVSNHYSIVNILLSTDFRASAKIQRSRVDGIVAWDGKKLHLKNVPKTRDVKIGDVVLTSEYSNMYPRNIRIGTVTDVQESESSLFKTIIVTPDLDFIKLDEVFVLNYLPDTERKELEERSSIRTTK